MRIKAIEPTVEKESNSTLADARETHPAYGQIAASRVSGTSVLYGSDFVSQHYVNIRIHKSVLNRGLSRDWPFAREELIEVSLTEAQWATFVSSMNMGSGVQCTLERFNGEQIPPISKPTDRREQFSAELKERFAIASEEIQALREKICGMKISQKQKEELCGALDCVNRNIAPNAKFVADQFDEHMENTVEKAKVEVASYIEAHIKRAGIAALNGEKVLELNQ